MFIAACSLEYERADGIQDGAVQDVVGGVPGAGELAGTGRVIREVRDAPPPLRDMGVARCGSCNSVEFSRWDAKRYLKDECARSLRREADVNREPEALRDV